MKNFFAIFSLIILSLAAEAKVKIGFVAGFTGSDNNTARELYRGVEVFFAENPKALDLFEVKKADNESSISKTVEVLESMHADNIKIVIGIANSNEALAAAKYTNDKGMLFITPFATNTEITKGKPLAFRVCFTDQQQGQALAKYTLDKIKAKKILILKNTDSKYSQGLSEYYKSALGPKIEITEHTYSNDLKDADYSRINQAFLVAKPDLVFIPDHIMRASLLTKKLKPLLGKISVLGGDGFGGRKIFLAIMGEETDVSLAYSTHWEESLSNEANKSFVKHYRKKFSGEAPTSGAAFTYDLMKLLYKNEKELGETNISMAKLAKSIRSKSYQSTVGPMKFQEDDNSPVKPIIMMSFKDGKYVQAN